MSTWAFPSTLFLLCLTSESLQGGESRQQGCWRVWAAEVGAWSVGRALGQMLGLQREGGEGL